MTASPNNFAVDFKALWDLPDDKFALGIYGLFLEYVARSRGVTAYDLSDKSIHNFASAVPGIRSKSQSGSVLASGFTMILENDPEGAGALFRNHFEKSFQLIAALEELATGSRRQSQNAKHDRGDHLTRLIREIVTETEGEISANELRRRLLIQGDESYWRVIIRGQSHRIIQCDQEDNEEEIIYLNMDGTGTNKASRKAIADRLTRAKKKYQENTSR